MQQRIESVPDQLSRVQRFFAIVFANDMAKIGAGILVIFFIMALFSPIIATHNPNERIETESGDWIKNHPPSLEYPLGTTTGAYSLFSQIVYGTRVAFIAGFLTAVVVGGVGTLIGIVAGYYGGLIENTLMRIVDGAYGIPFIPFIIVLIIVADNRSIYYMVFAISVILWRGSARVIRAEVISIKEQPMIDAAKASGASNRRIILYHILPKVLPTGVLYAVFAVGWAILAEAGLSFLGFGGGNLISWGRILNEAYANHALTRDMWVWILAPGVCIVLFVLSTYFVAQGLEEVVNPQLRER